jgi:hypothetical protein
LDTGADEFVLIEPVFFASLTVPPLIDLLSFSVDAQAPVKMIAVAASIKENALHFIIPSLTRLALL